MIDIGDVSRQSGLPPSTLRYYEERGLINSSGRRGLRRTFEASTLTRLALIELGRAAGFGLDEIAKMLPTAGTPQIDRERLRERAEEISHKVRRLEAVREMLLHTASCPEADHLGCPNFQRMLRTATKHHTRKMAATKSAASKRAATNESTASLAHGWWQHG